MSQGRGSLQSSQTMGYYRCRRKLRPGLIPMREEKPVPLESDHLSGSRRMRKDTEEGGTESSRGKYWSI